MPLISTVNLVTSDTDLRIQEDPNNPNVDGNSTINIVADPNFFPSILWSRNINGVDGIRWAASVDTSPETGGNTGSDFGIARFNDNSGFTSTPINIDREHGTVRMNDLFKVPVRTEASVPAGALEDGLMILDPGTGTIKYYWNGQWEELFGTAGGFQVTYA